MSTYPRLEARVSALERRQTNTETHIEEVNGEITTEIKQLARSIDASFKQASDYDAAVEKQVDARFNQVDARFNQVDVRFNQVDVRFDKIEERLDKIETALVGMETRILDAFRQLLTAINPQRPPTE